MYRSLFCLVVPFMFQYDAKHTEIGRILELFPVIHFYTIKSFIIVLLYQLQNKVTSVISLNQHLPFAVRASRPATHLFHKLKSPFVHPEIGEAQEAVRAQYTHKPDMVKIEPLDNHLRADKNIKPPAFKIGK